MWIYELRVCDKDDVMGFGTSGLSQLAVYSFLGRMRENIYPVFPMTPVAVLYRSPKDDPLPPIDGQEPDQSEDVEKRQPSSDDPPWMPLWRPGRQDRRNGSESAIHNSLTRATGSRNIFGDGVEQDPSSSSSSSLD